MTDQTQNCPECAKSGDHVILRRRDGKFDLSKIDDSGQRVKVSEEQFPLPYDAARKLLAGGQLWICEEATHRINIADATLIELTGFAGRIVKLLGRKPSNGDPIAELDDLIGAIYALVSAIEHDFKGKTGTSERDPVVKRAQQVANGNVRTEGNWMAGFHFNNALFRISALLDRLPKALAGSHKKAANMYLAKTGHIWDHTNADAVRVEVNRIKHDAQGAFSSRKEGMQKALSAVTELLELGETLT